MEEKSIVPEAVSSKEVDNRRIALIDADFIPYYVCHNKKNEEGVVIEKTFEECKRLADEFIVNIVTATKATHYLMCFTVGKCFRYKVYPRYKGQRKYDVIPFINETKKYLIDTYQGVFERNWLEADDIVAILKRHYGDKSFIVSPDKDILYLEGTHWNPKKGEWVTTTQDEAKIYFWKSMIIGDTADNIKGIPKKGEAYANALISDVKFATAHQIAIEYVNHFGEADGIEELYKNYKCLKIVEQDDSFQVDEIVPIEVKPKEEKLNEIGDKNEA